MESKSMCCTVTVGPWYYLYSYIYIWFGFHFNFVIWTCFARTRRRMMCLFVKRCCDCMGFIPQLATCFWKPSLGEWGELSSSASCPLICFSSKTSRNSHFEAARLTFSAWTCQNATPPHIAHGQLWQIWDRISITKNPGMPLNHWYFFLQAPC